MRREREALRRCFWVMAKAMTYKNGGAMLGVADDVTRRAQVELK